MSYSKPYIVYNDTHLCMHAIIIILLSMHPGHKPPREVVDHANFNYIIVNCVNMTLYANLERCMYYGG